MPELRVLRLDDLAEVQRAGEQKHGDDDEADGDLVGDHLRRRAQRRKEWILRVRGPAAHDHAVNRQRRDGEDVERADVEVGDSPALVDRDHRPGRERQQRHDEGREQEHALVGAGRDDRLLQHELEQVGEGLQQPPRAHHVGAAAQLHRRPDLAVGVKDVGDEDEEDHEERQALHDHQEERQEPGHGLLRRLLLGHVRQGRGFRHDLRRPRDRVGEIEVDDRRGETVASDAAGRRGRESRRSAPSAISSSRAMCGCAA